MIFLLLFFSFILSFNSITTPLGPKELFCGSYNLTSIGNPPVKLTFMVSCTGENEKNIEILFKTNKNEILIHHTQKSHLLKDLLLSETGLYHFCFRNLDQNNKKITFYITNDEILKDSNIEKQALDSLGGLLNQAINGIKKVLNIEDINKATGDSHMELLQRKLIVIKACMGVKLLVLLVIGIVQYLVIKTLFLNGK